MKPLKVIHSFPVWLPNTQTWMYTLVRSLPPECIESHIVCNTTENLEQFDLPRIHSLDNQAWKLRANQISGFMGVMVGMSHLRQKVKELQPDVVHSHFGDVAVNDDLVLKGLGVCHVMTCYGFDVSMLPRRNPLYARRLKGLFSRVSAVFCEGPCMAGQVAKLGCQPEKIRVQHLGVDLSRFRYRQREWNPESTLKILICGSFREKKGIPYAVLAIGKIANDYDIEVTVIGDATDSHDSKLEKRKIIDSIQESGLGDKIKLLGFRTHNELMEAAYQHHLLVSTSVQASNGDNEGGAPVTIIELAATGMPIVSSNHCDIPHVILDGEGGWLALERDVDSIVQNLKAAIENYRMWPKVTAKTRERIEQEFDLETQGLKMADHYAALRTS